MTKKASKKYKEKDSKQSEDKKYNGKDKKEGIFCEANAFKRSLLLLSHFV